LIPKAALKRIAKTRLGDATVLLNNHRLDGASYLCGYAVEVALKLRICELRNWEGQPEDDSEDPGWRALMTHNLDNLLQLANVQREVLPKCYSDWQILRQWHPATRYDPIGSVSRGQAAGFIQAADRILKVIIP